MLLIFAVSGLGGALTKGSGVEGFMLRVKGLGFKRLKGLGFKGLGFRVWGERVLGLRV